MTPELEAKIAEIESDAKSVSVSFPGHKVGAFPKTILTIFAELRRLEGENERLRNKRDPRDDLPLHDWTVVVSGSSSWIGCSRCGAQKGERNYACPKAAIAARGTTK